MPSWLEAESDKQRNERQKDDIRALERGDIPSIAKRRIEKHLAREDKFFSSNLSVREFLLCKEIGVEPISQVLGTCNFNISMVGGGYNVSLLGAVVGYRSTGEVHALTDALSKSRELAVKRMLVEAELLGASGVIGVRIVHTKPTSKGGHSEFTAYGTAIRVPDYPVGVKPFTSTFDGQEYWQLRQAGYHPISVVMGACSYYICTDWNASQQMNGFLGFGNSQNQEINQYTQGFACARERAMYQLEQELRLTDSQGVVDVDVDHDIEEIVYERNRSECRNLLVNFTVLGTAVEKVKEITPPSPLFCIDLRKGKTNTIIDLS